jgi:FtsP/CotA-like multicopper oxidase with cupredoxin domain
MNRATQTTRRQVLGKVGTALTATVLAGCASQQDGSGGTATETTEPTGETTTAETETTATGTASETTQPNVEERFELGGRTSGWVGQTPEAIADQTNPTLRLTPGETYTVVWKNLDGVIHNFVIENADGDALVRTEDATEKGATRQVTFEATEEMAEYYCQYHPTRMRGEVAVEGAAATTTTGTTNGTSTSTSPTTSSDSAY